MSWKGTLRSLEAAARRAEREAVKRQRELEKQHKQLEKMQEMERAAYEVQVYENYVDVLVTIYKDASEPWDWKEIQKADHPTAPTKLSAYEISAQDDLDSYKPGLIDKLLKGIETKQNELVLAVESGKTKDELEYQEKLKEYKTECAEWEAISKLAGEILSGDVNAYTEAIRQIAPFNEISQLGSSLNFKVDKSNLVEAVLHVNSEDVIPNETKTLLKSGKLSVKKITKSKFYELYQDYVCGGALRVARELFALLPVEMTIVTAVGELLNTKTGYMEELPILSVAIPRKTLNKLNFDLLDPSDSMDNFLHKMKFMKTKGFQPIEKIKPSDLER